MKSFNKKYPKRYNEEELKAALTRIRTGIQTSSSGYLVGNSFSFAGMFPFAGLPLVSRVKVEVAFDCDASVMFTFICRIFCYRIGT